VIDQLCRRESNPRRSGRRGGKGRECGGRSTKARAGKAAAEKSGKNHGKAQTSGESAPVPVAPEVSVPIEQSWRRKLLKAVQAEFIRRTRVRNYITGDVRIEAEWTSKGRIGAMKIFAGPKQFRQVAMDALRAV